jgi:hypothetical protein
LRKFPHQGAPLGGGRKRGDYEEAIGRSRGGRITKIHALTDDENRPRVLLLSPGNINDIALAPALLAAAGPIKRLIADKATTPTGCANFSPPSGRRLSFLQQPAAINHSPMTRGSTVNAT